jgi:ABC-2 type transport system permease protein
VLSFSAFWIGQHIFAGHGLDVSITAPDVLRAVIGGALYLAEVGLLGVGIGTIVRRTAGAVAAPRRPSPPHPRGSGFLPSSFLESSGNTSRPGPI